MSDIVERLRSPEFADVAAKYLMAEAADEIEMLRRVEIEAAEWVEERTRRLRADNERLRAALQKIESEMHGIGMSRQIARAALEGK